MPGTWIRPTRLRIGLFADNSATRTPLMSNAAISLYERYMNLSSIASMEPIVVDHARGALIWDSDAKEYVDCFGGIAVINAGHCDPRVLEAAREQMERVVHCV